MLRFTPAALLLATLIALPAEAQQPTAAPPGQIDVIPLGSACTEAVGCTVTLGITRDGAPLTRQELGATIRERVEWYLFDLPAAEAPTLDVGFAPADDGGWIISLARGGAALPADEVEVRVSVDFGDHVVAAGDRFHLPALTDGLHEIDIRLFTPEGRAYLRDGIFVGRHLVVLQQGSNAGLADPTLIDVSLTGMRPTGPDVVSARLGAATEIRITSSDYDVGLRLQGYGIEGEAWPSLPVSLLFNADRAGRFALETSGGEPILHLEVTP